MKKSPEITEKILAALPACGTVADVGCGSGELLLELARRGWKAIGVDPSPTVPERPEYRVFRGRAEQLPLSDGSADAVVLQCVFSLCKPEETVRELARVLRPGGTLVVADLYARKGGEQPDGGPDIGRVETREQIEAQLAGPFRLESFSEESEALLMMVAQSILDGTACVSREERKALKQISAGYGLWVWTRNA